MALKVEDLEDLSKYRQIAAISYDELVPFIFEWIRKRSALMTFFWAACVISLFAAIRIRFNIHGYFPYREIFLHSCIGMIILPIVCIPVHEFLHIVPYWLSGARQIRVGMDLKQYLFYVTAHRHVASPLQFRIVALVPFILISAGLIILIIVCPGPWKWSLSSFLFVHTTMCAGDFALLNFYHLRTENKIYTWDDADRKIAYFYEEI
jgi:hypothetical protein